MLGDTCEPVCKCVCIKLEIIGIDFSSNRTM